MTKFYILFDKKRSSALFSDADKAKVIERGKAVLTDTPKYGYLVVMEAVTELRLTASPVDVKEILSADQAVAKMEKDGKEVTDSFRKLESSHSEALGAVGTTEETPTKPMDSLADLVPVKFSEIDDRIMYNLAF